MLDGASGALSDGTIPDLRTLLEPGDVLVFNDTRVIPARLYGHKATGGRVEVLVERVLGEREALVHIKASKALKEGSIIHLDGGYLFRVAGRSDSLFHVVSESAATIHEVMAAVGHVPLPPYIERGDSVIDAERYQTVYGHVPGAVAAPTAGLHFDTALLDDLRAAGVQFAYVTLHVGAGTFQPVRADAIEDHVMHSEVFDVSASLCRQIEAARHAGKRIVAVGTTSVRALESAAAGGRLQARQGETDIFIYPGYRFQAVDAMLTNFHLPESTLLMLVSAFAGREHILRAYEHAIRARYRFFSYGDAMWITRGVSA
jgi:S-adenosylmethionine:tRNA ribosyltransferase-isomerase